MTHTEKTLRKAYVKAFGCEYDDERHTKPLPLYIAYQVSLRKLKRSKQHITFMR